MKNSLETALAIIKPDAIRDVLDGPIIRDLETVGFNVIWRKICLIPQEAVPLIYPEKTGRVYFSSIVRSLTLGPAMVLLVQGESIYSRAMEVKGKTDLGGIRHKYVTWSRKQLAATGYTEEAFADKIAENRLHISDSIDDTARECALFMSTPEIAELETIAPEVFVHLSGKNSTLSPVR